MAIPFIASNEFLNPATAIDLTSSPQLVLTNNSTFTNADNLTTIEGDEVSGSGYARINLSVLSNSVQPGGDYKLIYDLAQITPSGGSIAFDRVVLISGSNWVGYWQYGTTTIANGQTYPFRGMTIQRTDQGTLVNGQNGLPAWTTTSASFTHPASVGQTVSVTVGQTSFMAVGSYVYFDDGVSRTQYKVTAIGSGTNATLERTTDEVVGGTTMQSGGKLVPSGKNGEDGVDGINSFGLAYTYSSTLTAPPSSGQVRLNNATLSSVTAIYASETDRNSVNISTILNSLNPGSILQLVDESTPLSAWAIYQLNTLVDSGSYSTIGVTHIGSTGTFSGDVRLVFANKGNTGATGADGLGWTGGSYNPATGIVTFTSDDGLGFSTSDLRGATGAAGADGTDGLGWTGGSYNAGTGIVTFTSDDGLGFATGDLRGEDGITGFGLKYTFSATTTSPPNTQEVRLNNALPASATSIFIHETDRNSNNVASVLAALTVGSAIMILDESDPTAYALYTISSNTDNGTDRTIGVASNAVGPGSFSGDVVVAFSIKGDTGATGAPGSVSAASEIDLTQISTPSDPGAGVTSLYAKNDGKVYYLPGGGVETLVGSSGTLYDAPAIVNSGTTYTTTGTPAIVPLTLDNNCTITLPTPPGSGVYNLEYWLYQDNTGGRAVTWASTGGTSIKWSDSATAPTIATSATYLTRMGFSIRNPDTIWRGLRVWQQIETTVLNKGIFAYGSTGTVLSISNLVSINGIIATDTTGVGTARECSSAAEYGGDKAIFAYGFTGVNVSISNLVSNTGVVATDTAGVGTARNVAGGAGYGTNKAIFAYGSAGASVSISNLVSNTGVVATDTAGVGTARSYVAATEYGGDKAVFAYGFTVASVSISNLVSNTGVVATDTAGVGTARYGASSAAYGGDKAIFAYGFTGSVHTAISNLVSNTGVVATDTAGVGTARSYLAATEYGGDKAIFAYGFTGVNVSISNLVSNTGIVATDTAGVGTARYNPGGASFGG